ncbi:MAG: hypothetical protein P8181_13085, partial [bacterium]
MFIKQKQVRRSKFTSRFASTARRRREYVASVYSMGVIQAFLIIFLTIGAIRSFEVMREKFPDLPVYAQLGVPAVMGVIGLLVLRAFIRNVQHAVELTRDERSRAESPASRDDGRRMRGMGSRPGVTPDRADPKRNRPSGRGDDGAPGGDRTAGGGRRRYKDRSVRRQSG